MFLLDVIILLKNRMKIMSENKTTEIDVVLLEETDKIIKIGFGVNATNLPKEHISILKQNNGDIIKVELPQWLYDKTFVVSFDVYNRNN
jgi:hypothetical protein